MPLFSLRLPDSSYLLSVQALATVPGATTAVTMWQKALKDLKRAGLIEDDDAVTRLFLMGALNWTVQWYRPDGPRSIEQIARQLADFVLGKAPRG